MTEPGLFISFEGGEGSGKTTQIAALAASLEQNGHTVRKTREPGGTPDAEKIRNLLVNRDGGNWTPTAECLLFYAARNMHVETLIKPALTKGETVISDRFADSTVAYQCYGHGVDRGMVGKLHNLVLGNFAPDITFILDIDPKAGLKRALARGGKEDRFEQLDIAFHERLRRGYLDIAAAEPERCVVIDAAQDAELIAEEILKKTTRAIEKNKLSS